MAARTLALATTILLGLTGLVLAQAPTTWQEPGQRPAAAPADAQPRTREAQAATREPAPAAREAQPQARRAAPPRMRPWAERRREVRSARYSGGSGATWRTGRDTHGFAGTFGGCSFRGYAGPNGYRVDRNC